MYSARTNYKPFSRSLYAENDSVAKEHIQTILLQTPSLRVFPSPQLYDIDLRVYRDGEHVGYIETEIKHGWRGEKYPFSDVRFPYRKAKYLQLDKPTVFVMFNHTCSHHLAVTAQDILSSPVVQIDNKEMRNESFFAVPLEKIKWDWLSSWQ